MGAVIRIDVNTDFYLRDPGDTKLGRNIVKSSIEMIDKLGFEKFTFKKLADKIHSTEASVYRYFESKHQLLSYLVSWYWSWLEYLITTRTINMKDPHEKLSTVIRILIESGKDDPLTEFVDEAVLHKIAIAESTRAYTSSNQSPKNRKSVLAGYGQFGKIIVDLFKEINPKFRYPKALFVTLVTSCHRLILFRDRFPEVTEFKAGGKSTNKMATYLEDLVLASLNGKT